eukprot:TRINITY_DN12527_c0_g1_i2.p1 TRINITY_DN12527_c0_g1~~TRINITY_DN12527_c0_g1_i2.p1  ORF type:complete len:1713 (+),score=257.70 TRINITY_DN12527_c0_g1_i2:130-5139(+)
MAQRCWPFSNAARVSALLLGLRFGIAAVLAPVTSPSVTGPWTLQTAAAEWGKRDAFEAVTLQNGSVLIMGGSHGTDCVNDVWRTSAEDAGSHWDLLMESNATGPAWSPRKFFGAVVLTDGSVLVMGGYDGHYAYFNDVWLSRPPNVGAAWTLQVQHAGWRERSAFAVLALKDGSVLVMGGCCFDNDVWRSPPGSSGSEWELQTAKADWRERAHLAAVELPPSAGAGFAGKVLVIGGRSGDAQQGDYLSDVWMGDALGTTWELRTEAAGWGERYSIHALVLSDGSVIVLAGASRGNVLYNDVWRSPPTSAGAVWQQEVAAAAWSPRIGVAALLTQGKYSGMVLMMGGFSNTDGPRLHDVWRTELPCNYSQDLAPQLGSAGDCVSNTSEWRVLTSSSSCQAACNEGFTASGRQVCTDGSVGQVVCKPSACNTSLAIINGSSGDCPEMLPSSGACQPACDEGYYASGFTTCEYGVLSAATCEPKTCIIAAPPTNGDWGDCPRLLLSDASCEPTCSPGYTVTGSSSCSLGVLMAASCQPDPCLNVLAPENGMLGDCPGNMTSNTTCQPVCTAGYTSTGPTRCLLGQLTATSCLANPCFIDGAPEHGSSGTCSSVLESGTMCMPQCDPGYSPSNPSVCLFGDFTPTRCLADPCNTTLAPLNGSRGNCPDMLPSGVECQPLCDSGFTSSGRSSCLLGNLTAAVCVPDGCNMGRAPRYGDLGDCPDRLESGESCQPACQDRYTATGRTSCYLGVLAEATCEPDACSNASLPPLYGSAGDCPNVLPSFRSCQPTCNDGYTVSGQATCFLGSFEPATCMPSSCRLAGPPGNATLGDCPAVLESGAECQPQCYPGYYASGASSCEYGNLTLTNCTGLPCNYTTFPPYGSRGGCPDVLLSGTECLPQCDPGYILNSTASCRLGMLRQAVCAPEPCDMVVPNNSDIGDCPAVLPSGASCQPVCDPGYTASGLSTCQLGKLSATECRPNSCNITKAPDSGFFGDCPRVLQHGETCQPTCDDLYSVSGQLECHLGNLSDVWCTPFACNTSSLEATYRGVWDCPELMESGDSCELLCEDGFVSSHRLRCLFGYLGSQPEVFLPDSNVSVLELEDANLSCHPTTMPICIAKPCHTGLELGQELAGDCPPVLPSGATCQPGCPAGWLAAGPATCLLGNMTVPGCLPDDSPAGILLRLGAASTDTTTTTTASEQVGNTTTTTQPSLPATPAPTALPVTPVCEATSLMQNSSRDASTLYLERDEGLSPGSAVRIHPGHETEEVAVVMSVGQRVNSSSVPVQLMEGLKFDHAAGEVVVLALRDSSSSTTAAPFGPGSTGPAGPDGPAVCNILDMLLSGSDPLALVVLIFAAFGVLAVVVLLAFVAAWAAGLFEGSNFDEEPMTPLAMGSTSSTWSEDVRVAEERVNQLRAQEAELIRRLRNFQSPPPRSATPPAGSSPADAEPPAEHAVQIDPADIDVQLETPRPGSARQADEQEAGAAVAAPKQAAAPNSTAELEVAAAPEATPIRQQLQSADESEDEGTDEDDVEAQRKQPEEEDEELEEDEEESEDESAPVATSPGSAAPGVAAAAGGGGGGSHDRASTVSSGSSAAGAEARAKFIPSRWRHPKGEVSVSGDPDGTVTVQHPLLGRHAVEASDCFVGSEFRFFGYRGLLKDDEIVFTNGARWLRLS